MIKLLEENMMKSAKRCRNACIALLSIFPRDLSPKLDNQATDGASIAVTVHSCANKLLVLIHCVHSYDSQKAHN